MATLGPAAAPRRSVYEIADNECESAMTPNTYCIHVIDAARLAFGLETVRALVYGNSLRRSETCIRASTPTTEEWFSTRARARRSVSSSQLASRDRAQQQLRVPAERRLRMGVLELGEKIGFSRVVPGAGVCVPQ